MCGQPPSAFRQAKLDSLPPRVMSSRPKWRNRRHLWLGKNSKASPARRDKCEKSLNGMLFDLVDGDVWGKDQFAPPVHPSRAAAVRKVPQCLASVIDSLHRLAGCGWVVFRYALKDALQVVRGECRPPNFHRAFPSGAVEPIEPLTDLLVRQVVPAIQGCLAKLDGFNKAGFFRKIAADSLSRERIRVTALLSCQFRKLMLLFSREMYFHNVSLG
jgi:hypothetical protein